MYMIQCANKSHFLAGMVKISTRVKVCKIIKIFLLIQKSKRPHNFWTEFVNSGPSAWRITRVRRTHVSTFFH